MLRDPAVAALLLALLVSPGPDGESGDRGQTGGRERHRHRPAPRGRALPVGGRQSARRRLLGAGNGFSPLLWKVEKSDRYLLSESRQR